MLLNRGTYSNVPIHQYPSWGLRAMRNIGDKKWPCVLFFYRFRQVSLPPKNEKPPTANRQKKTPYVLLYRRKYTTIFWFSASAKVVNAENEKTANHLKITAVWKNTAPPVSARKPVTDDHAGRKGYRPAVTTITTSQVTGHSVSFFLDRLRNRGNFRLFETIGKKKYPDLDLFGKIFRKLGDLRLHLDSRVTFSIFTYYIYIYRSINYICIWYVPGRNFRTRYLSYAGKSAMKRETVRLLRDTRDTSYTYNIYLRKSSTSCHSRPCTDMMYWS